MRSLRTKNLDQDRLTVKTREYKGSSQKLHEVLEGEDNNQEKVFNVKSLRVDWKGKSSYMHVFFINNDSHKLDEANNNIKLQKIMFASISHEFRTPLNAIINSYYLSTEVFTEYSRVVNELAKLSKNK